MHGIPKEYENGALILLELLPKAQSAEASNEIRDVLLNG